MRRLFVLSLVGVLLALAAGTVSAQQRTYTVRPGDTLTEIAATFNTTVSAIMSANNIVDPGRIFAGQVLLIPATGGPVVSTNRTYTVQPGDQLRFIAARFGTTWRAIAELNNLSNPNRIFAGQVLLIPGTGGPVVTPPTTTPPPVVGGRYIVQPGDTLFRIGARFGVNIYDIARANAILNLNRIFAGQALLIPGR